MSNEKSDIKKRIEQLKIDIAKASRYGDLKTIAELQGYLDEYKDQIKENSFEGNRDKRKLEKIAKQVYNLKYSDLSQSHKEEVQALYDEDYDPDEEKAGERGGHGGDSAMNEVETVESRREKGKLNYGSRG